MNQGPGLQPPRPVLVAELFPELLSELITLLSGLSEADWQQPTACAGWTVKDVALHLLGGEIGNLSRRRDGVSRSAQVNGWAELVTFINDWNQAWVEAARRMSPRVLIDLIQLTGRQMSGYIQSLDPYALGPNVSWARPGPAPVWLDVAREYTERWHHQQHIRDAVGQPGLKQPRYMAPVLATFVHALPRTYQPFSAPTGAIVTLTITGASGGQWSVAREPDEWRLYEGGVEQPNASATLADDDAWRLFTRGLSGDEARARLSVAGDMTLGWKVLDAAGIIA